MHDPAFAFNALVTQTPTRVIAIAGLVSVLTQLVKRILPNVSGPVAMGVNLLFSLAGIFASMDPSAFWTVGTFDQVLAVFAAAAGIHSTARSLRNNGALPDARLPATVLTLALAIGFGGLSGCAAQGAAKVTAPLPALAVDRTDAAANQNLQAIHAFAASVTADVQGGKLTLSPTQKTALVNLNRAINTADAAEQAYHAAGGGNASVLSASVAAAQSALMQVQAALVPSATN